MDWQLLSVVIGLFLILEGLPYLLFPERTLRVLRQLEEMGPSMLRLLGISAVIAGVALLILAHRYLA